MSSYQPIEDERNQPVLAVFLPRPHLISSVDRQAARAEMAHEHTFHELKDRFRIGDQYLLVQAGVIFFLETERLAAEIQRLMAFGWERICEGKPFSMTCLLMSEMMREEGAAAGGISNMQHHPVYKDVVEISGRAEYPGIMFSAELMRELAELQLPTLFTIQGQNETWHQIDWLALSQQIIAKHDDRRAKAKNFTERLIERVQDLQSHLVIGLDPNLERFPLYLQQKYRSCPNQPMLREILYEFNLAIIAASRHVAVAYKPQAAFYELYGLAGMQALKDTLDTLNRLDIPVIFDGKRNDVSHTATAYAQAWLKPSEMLTQAQQWRADAITVNPYLGTDGVQPFLSTAPEAGLFLLCKTSNPSSGELQDLVLANQQTVFGKVAQLANQWGADSIGEHGYSRVGLVVGATYPETALTIRKLAPNAIFLMPGVGAQGGATTIISRVAGPRGFGALANSSRQVLYPFKPEMIPTSNWTQQVTDLVKKAAETTKDQLETAFI